MQEPHRKYVLKETWPWYWLNLFINRGIYSMYDFFKWYYETIMSNKRNSISKEPWYFTKVELSQSVGEFSTYLMLMKATFKNNQKPDRYRALRWGWVSLLGGNYWNNGVTYFPALCVCLYEFVWERAGRGALWQVGGSHLFPALQEISSRTFYPGVL